jgi:hypothetical protein
LGTATGAAVFFETALRELNVGSILSAILPDVLRSGSRYRTWRQHILQRGIIKRISTHGLFDRTADVDVFLLHMQVTKAGEARCWPRFSSGRRGTDGVVGDRFNVHVGTVVPHRDPEDGPLVPYIHARDLPKWTVHSPNDAKRRHSGRTFRPPFIVVRRTSRPGDSKRAVATIIRGDSTVAVENHLLVLLPIEGTLTLCKELLAVLRSPRTDSWLDTRIRCRHITVEAISGLPWWV